MNLKKHIFKHYDQILVRHNCDDTWKPRLFAEYNDDDTSNKYGATNGIFYRECLPYEDYSILAGTKNY